MFVRVETGIRRFEAMIEAADRDDVWGRMAKLQRRYELQCPKCEKKFWITPELIKTSWGEWNIRRLSVSRVEHIAQNHGLTVG